MSIVRVGNSIKTIRASRPTPGNKIRRFLCCDSAASDADAASTSEHVNIEYRGVTVEARRGSRLRTAMLKNGISPHNGDSKLINCRGLGTCGTCAVEIKGNISPPTWTTVENLRLNFPPHKSPGNQLLRLACQVRCESDLRVIKRDGFWGSGNSQLEDLMQSTTSRVASTTESAETGQDMTHQNTVPEPKGVLGMGVTPLGDLEYLLDRK